MAKPWEKVEGETQEERTKRLGREKTRRWQEKNSRAVKENWDSHNSDKDYHKNHKLVKKYSMTLEDFIKMVDARGGKCDICGQFFGKELHVDHNHSNGKVRGLLCFKCNSGLGAFGDNPNLMSKAVNYLCQRYGGARDFVPYEKGSIC